MYSRFINFTAISSIILSALFFSGLECGAAAIEISDGRGVSPSAKGCEPINGRMTNVITNGGFEEDNYDMPGWTPDTGWWSGCQGIYTQQSEKVEGNNAVLIALWYQANTTHVIGQSIDWSGLSNPRLSYWSKHVLPCGGRSAGVRLRSEQGGTIIYTFESHTSSADWDNDEFSFNEIPELSGITSGWLELWCGSGNCGGNGSYFDGFILTDDVDTPVVEITNPNDGGVVDQTVTITAEAFPGADAISNGDFEEDNYDMPGWTPSNGWWSGCQGIYVQQSEKMEGNNAVVIALWSQANTTHEIGQAIDWSDLTDPKLSYWSKHVLPCGGRTAGVRLLSEQGGATLYTFESHGSSEDWDYDEFMLNDIPELTGITSGWLELWCGSGNCGGNGSYFDAVKLMSSGDSELDRVEFLIDDVLECSDDTSPYSCEWDTTGSENGPHTIDAIAYNMAGNNAGDQINVTVANPTPVPTPVPVTTPLVEIISPPDGAIVDQTVNITAEAFPSSNAVTNGGFEGDNYDMPGWTPNNGWWSGCQGIYVQQSEKMEGNNAVVIALWSQANTTHEIGQAVDWSDLADPKLSYWSKHVLPCGGRTAGVRLLTEQNGATLYTFESHGSSEDWDYDEFMLNDITELTGITSGWLELWCGSGNCGGNGSYFDAVKLMSNGDSELDRVEFLIDDVLECSDDSSPYSCEWDTTGVNDGLHEIKAMAYNFAGLNAADQIEVNVDNVEPTSTPTLTPTLVPTDTPTLTPTPTHSPTLVPTDTPTLTPSHTPTLVPTDTPTLTPSHTPTLIPTDTPTLTPSHTPTLIPTDTPTYTPTDTPTESPVPTYTPTVTPTPTAAPIPAMYPTGGIILIIIVSFALTITKIKTRRHY